MNRNAFQEAVMRAPASQAARSDSAPERESRSAGRSQRRPLSLIAAVTTVASAALLASGTLAQDRETVQLGEQKFDHMCAPCHGAGVGNEGHQLLPGTEALQIKYQGRLPALLEERTDLTAEALRVFVRRGTMSMPPFRPTEITDAEIDAIAAYLAETSRN